MPCTLYSIDITPGDCDVSEFTVFKREIIHCYQQNITSNF
jgi:hypothetical protein